MCRCNPVDSRHQLDLFQGHACGLRKWHVHYASQICMCEFYCSNFVEKFKTHEHIQALEDSVQAVDILLRTQSEFSNILVRLLLPCMYCYVRHTYMNALILCSYYLLT